MLTDFKCGMIMIGGYVFSGFFAAAITMFLSMLIGTDNILICHIIVAVAWSVGAFIGTKKPVSYTHLVFRFFSAAVQSELKC